MENRVFIIKKQTLYSFFAYLLLLPLLYFFINFDSDLNLDYGGYKDNYEGQWNQFEVGYSALEYVARYFMLPFESFWVGLVLIQLILIAILYTNTYVFLLAFPNLIFLSQGLLGTQIRFGIASLICLVIFKLFFLNRRYYFYNLFSVLFHNGTTIFVFLSSFLKGMFNIDEKINYKKNLKSFFLFILVLVLLTIFVDFILLSLGYYYYVDPDSKHMVVRSTTSLLYMTAILFFIFLVLRTNNNGNPIKYAPMVYLGALILVFSIVFFKFSMISGRYNLVFLMVEPFILLSFYHAIGKKNISGFFLFLVFFCITNSKLLLLNLIF